MTDFKVGDRVRWKDREWFGEGVVISAGESFGYDTPRDLIRVRFDSQMDDYDDTDGLDFHLPKIKDLELVETALTRQAREYRESVEPKSDLEKVAEQLITAGKITGSAPIRTHVIEDDVNRPAHYNSGKIEVWDFIYDQGLGYALGNATKYITRAGKKAGNSKVKDLRKAVAFLEREIRFEETGE